MKKRALSIILALTLLLALAVNAYAAEGEPEVHWFEGEYVDEFMKIDQEESSLSEPWGWYQTADNSSSFTTCGWTFDAETGLASRVEYYVMHDYFEGLALAGISDDGYSIKKFGYVDESGKAVIPAIYDQADDFCEGLAGVLVRDAEGKGQCGFINTSGETVIPLEYQMATAFGGGRAVVLDWDGSWFSLDRTGAKTAIAAHLSIGKQVGDLISVLDNVEGRNLYGVINTSGETVVESMYDDVRIDENGIITVRDGIKAGVYNGDGEVIAPVGAYDSPNILDDGCIIAYAYESGKQIWYILDPKGNVTATFEDRSNLRAAGDGAIYFTENGKTGLMDHDGKVLMPAGYEGAYLLGDGLVEFSENGKSGVKDMSGKVLVPAIYNGVMSGDNIIDVYNDDGRRGILDVSGNVIVPVGNIQPVGAWYGLVVYTNEDNWEKCIVNGKGETVIDGLENVFVSGKYVFVLRKEDCKVGYFVNPYYSEVPAAANMTDVKDWSEKGIDWALSNNLTDPANSMSFGAEMSCPRWEVVSIIWKAMGSQKPTTTENPFTDVSADDEYYDAVLWAYENEVANGVGDGKFDPNGTVTRGQTMTFIHRALDKPAHGDANPFDDVAAGEYYTDAVLWAAENGIAKGMTDTNFMPNENVTRAQAVTFLQRWVEKQK